MKIELNPDDPINDISTKNITKRSLPIRVNLYNFPRAIAKKFIYGLNPYNIFFHQVVGKMEALGSEELNIVYVDEGYSLEKVKKPNPKNIAIYTTNIKNENLLKIISEYQPKFILNEACLDKNRLIQTKDLVVSATESSKEKIYLERIKQQNKELEVFTEDLEKLVDARTKDIENSKNIILFRQKKIKDIVRLVKQLSQVDSTEELLKIIRQHVRVFSKIRDPILAFQASSADFRVSYFQGSEVVQRSVNERWPYIHHIRYNEILDRRYLANIFGRPFVKVIAIPFFIRSSNEPAILYLEHSLDKKEMRSFLNQLEDGLEPFYLALDRILLKDMITEKSDFWETTFNSIEDPVAIISENFDVVRANKSFTRVFKKGKCFKVFAGKDSICSDCPLVNNETKNIHLNERMYEVLTYPISEPGDASKFYVNYYLDVTQSKQLYSNLIQSEKMAALGLLAGNIAHELNNPLTGLRSMAQTLLMDFSGTDPVFQDLKEIESAAQRSQNIIKNLLEFSNGEITQRKKISLSQVVRKTLPLLKSSLSKHKLRLKLVEEESDLVYMNPNLLQQVVFNLMNNATQAIDEFGKVELKVTVSNTYVNLYVTDDGNGISPEKLEHIFEAFYTTKKEGKGTGLGLSMSRSIIENANGNIEVESRIGVGTSFKVSLPLV